MNRFVFLLLFLTIAPLPVLAEGKKPVVMEVFGSLGCPSCIPADKLIEELAARDKALTIVTCHVTYFDRGGWKDRFSQPFCGGRHSGYLLSVPLGAGFIPQFVLNGAYETTGYNKDGFFDPEIVLSLIEKARSESDVLPVDVTIKDGFLDIALAPTQLEKTAEIWLYAYDRKREGNPRADPGPDAAKYYINAAKHLVKLLDWNGESWDVSYPLKDVPAEGYTVLVQEKTHGRIFAAASVSP